MISTVIEAVRAVSQGNNEGKAFLYENTYKKAYYVALKYMKNEDDACDVVQDAYIKAFDRIDQLDNALKFESWLNTIVASTALDALKKKKPQLFTDISNDDEEFDVTERFEANYSEQPEVVIDKNETSRLVQEIISELSDEQRVCVTMYYIQEMPVKEISEVLDVSDNTVMSRLHYARKNIEKKVKELEKKGTKLYALAPIPFFVFLLGKEASACEAAAIAGLFSATGAGVATGTSTSAGTAGAATSAGAAATGMSLGAKIAIGITAAVVAVGGAVGAGGAIYNNDNSNDSETAVVAEQEQPTINSREVLSNYYDSTLVSQYGIADHEIILNYNDLGEGAFSFLSYTGKPGLMGKKFVDVDGDGNEEMLVAVCECTNVVDFYKGEDGVKVKINIYKADSNSKQVSELTNGQIETAAMKLYCDIIQCAYRIIDGKFYVYITDVYVMSLHQGGMEYATANVYTINNNSVVKLASSPNRYYEGSEGMEPAYEYMPSIVNAFNALSASGSYAAELAKISQTPDRRENTVLFAPFSKIDPEYTDVFSWNSTSEWDYSAHIGKLIGDWKFYE